MNNILDNKYSNDYENQEYYDETAEREEHTPRSRPIREKDSQPILEYDYEEVESSEPVIEPSKPRTHYSISRGPLTKEILLQLFHETQGDKHYPDKQIHKIARRVQGWGQRVGAVPQGK